MATADETLTPRRDPDVEARNALSSLHGLLALSMLMTERGDEREIVRLTATAVPSLAAFQLYGVFSFDSGWHGPPNARGDDGCTGGPRDGASRARCRRAGPADG